MREAGLAPRGSADHAVAHLSDDELRELGRLLREELGEVRRMTIHLKRLAWPSWLH